LSVNALYQQRFETVLTYIEDNLEGDLSVETLSAVAHFSAFHFHRQFSAYVGVPVARYVQLMRLRRAAHRLVGQPEHSVLDAALAAGFESPEAFSRAFRRAFGHAPSALRRRPDWQALARSRSANETARHKAGRSMQQATISGGGTAAAARRWRPGRSPRSPSGSAARLPGPCRHGWRTRRNRSGPCRTVGRAARRQWRAARP